MLSLNIFEEPGSLYDIWVKKYGEEEAKKRDSEWKAKVSAKSSGENNYWFGKTPPVGAGNGWQGWYKNWFFRSLHELFYMVNIIEKQGLKWENAERKEYKIQYIDEGKVRNHFADFIIEDKKMVEIKPIRLQTTRSVKIKAEAAMVFCKENGLEYEIVDPPKLTDEELSILYETKQIVFTEVTEQKYIKKYRKNE
jgi:hypothetical protein